MSWADVCTRKAGGAQGVGERSFDVEAVRRCFPALSHEVHGRPLIYLDNAAATQKPRAVIDAVADFYLHASANVHRGIHALSVQATQLYEAARAKVRSLLNAADVREIVFVRGATEGVNLAAWAYARKQLHADDEVVVSAMEHHSNIVPWQVLCREQGAKLRVAPIDDHGELLMEDYQGLLSARTKLVAITHVSNALGVVNPIQDIVKRAHAWGAKVLVDGAQAAPHLAIDVQELDCDFYVFSGHKMYGPTGIGVIYGKKELLDEASPYQTGGDMIRSVTFEHTTYDEPPAKFEAGTPNIAGAIGLGAAIEYLESLDRRGAAEHEADLLRRATDALLEIDGLRIIGDSPHKAAVISFVLDGIHPHDIGAILDHEGIAVRTGHHCAQPLMERFGVPATTRLSFGLYNTSGEVDAAAAAIRMAKEALHC